MSADRIEEFLSAVKAAFAGNTLVGLRLGGYHGAEADLKNVDIKKIVVKGVEKFSFTFHYKTRDIIKNHIQPEALGLLRTALRDEFRSAQLATTEFDMSLERNGDKVRVKSQKVAGRQAADTGHDRNKNRPLTATDKPYLQALGITGKDGQVRHVAPDDILLPPALEQRAREAFMAGRFSPGRVDGQVTKSRMRVEVVFE